MSDGFKITATDSELAIVITDPVIMERLITVLHRSNSTKVAAVREAIMTALTPAPAPLPEPDESVINSMISDFEALLAKPE